MTERGFIKRKTRSFKKILEGIERDYCEKYVIIPSGKREFQLLCKVLDEINENLTKEEIKVSIYDENKREFKISRE